VITIIDYGLGNVRAFVNVYKRLNIDVRTAETADGLVGASKLILPGVGAFDHAMQRLEQSGMREAIEMLVRERKVPVLGVCVGMQILARSSDEGVSPGLGWIPAQVKSFRSRPDHGLPLPHMGWNDVRPTRETHLFRELESARFYFLHSYYFECDDSADIAAVANYGTDFTCAVASANIYGVQFHPEKSHRFGTRLLRNFAEL